MVNRDCSDDGTIPRPGAVVLGIDIDPKSFSTAGYDKPLPV
jgi:hypothetical protein